MSNAEKEVSPDCGAVPGFIIGYGVPVTQSPCVLVPVPCKSANVVCTSASKNNTLAVLSPTTSLSVYKCSNVLAVWWKFQHGPHHVADASITTYLFWLR